MKQLKLDETEYTTLLATALNGYVKRISDQHLPAPLTPHSTRQSYKKLDQSSCFDLIQRISESSILILEIKVTHDGKKFHSFDQQQRVIDSALREAGIPIEYCYNKVDNYSEENNDIYTLEESLASPPDLVSNESGLIKDENRHQTLKKLVDELMNSSEGNGDNIGALFSKGLIERIRDLNIKMLFFAYHVDGLLLIDTSDLVSLYESYCNHVNLGEGIELSSVTKKELIKSFDSSSEALKLILSEYFLSVEKKGSGRGFGFNV